MSAAPSSGSDAWPGPPTVRQEAELVMAGRVLYALRPTAPAEIVPTLAALLSEELAGTDLQLHLTDYRMTALHPVGAAEEDQRPEAVVSSPVGQVFLTQRAAVESLGQERARVAVPVTVRGQRLGVLTVVLPVPAGEGLPAGQLAVMAAVADVLAHVVVEASRGSDVFEVSRRSARFTVAAEMQWQLLPGRAVATPEFTLAGQLEPAPYVQGDAFDWSADEAGLTLCAVHVTGHGQSAALLSTLAITALRNARRAGITLSDQASLADQAVYAEHGGDQHVSALLLHVDLDGSATVVDAGSPAMLRLRGDRAERVQLQAQLPLGMFDETPYAVEDLRFESGDRLLIATPGALEATSPDGRRFGEGGLLRQLEQTREFPPQEVARRVVAALVDHQGEDLTGDATVLCLDWRGRGADRSP